jgi:hypothetical protein
MGQIGDSQVKSQQRKPEHREKKEGQGQRKYYNQGQGYGGDSRPQFKPNNNKTNYVKTDGNYAGNKDSFAKPTFKQDQNKKNEELPRFKPTDGKYEKVEANSKFEFFFIFLVLKNPISKEKWKLLIIYNQKLTIRRQMFLILKILLKFLLKVTKMEIILFKLTKKKM